MNQQEDREFRAKLERLAAMWESLATAPWTNADKTPNEAVGSALSGCAEGLRAALAMRP